MSEVITGIRLQGGKFSEPKLLQFFTHKKTNPKICVLFGRNGSGKTTISKAFNKISNHDESSIHISELINKYDDKINITKELSESIYIFNEDYIENNIKLASNGLETIVLLGGNVMLENEITKQLQLLELKQQELDRFNQEFDLLNDGDNPTAPSYWLNQITLKLRGDDNWAGRDRIIKDKRQNAKVNDDTYTNFINRHPVKSRDELIVEFDRITKQLNEAKIGSAKVINTIDMPSKPSMAEDEFISLLSLKLENPVLSERERILFELLHKADYGLNHLERQKTFFNSNDEMCPFCLQRVTSNYKEELIQCIERVLSKTVDEHRHKLELFRLKSIVIPVLDCFRVCGSDVLENVIAAYYDYKDTVDRWNKLIDVKICNIYQPVVVDGFMLMDKYNRLNDALVTLRAKIDEYNKSVTDVNAIQNIACNINDDIAYYDIINLYTNYCEKVDNYGRIRENVIRTRSELNNINNIISDLKAKISDTELAVKWINKYLQFIFCDKRRIMLVFQDERYILKINGRNVSPRDISVGERNAIALCYFFTSIIKNKDPSTGYGSEYLLIIDDPITSFDSENRIGMLSFINYKLNELLSQNENTKILLMSHDLRTCFDFAKIQINGKSAQKSGLLNVVELKNCSTKLISELDNFHEYTFMLSNVFLYAYKGDPTLDAYIGNVIRKTLEAYCTFVYRCGVNNMKIINEVNKICHEVSDYFQSRLFRLFLNTSSHMEERVKAADDFDFFDYFNPEEKVITAKDAIVLLYILNSSHVIEHLTKSEAVKNNNIQPQSMIDTIEVWKKDIISRSPCLS